MQKSRRLKILVGLSTIPVAALLAWFLLTPENIDILKTVFSENMTNDEIQDHLGGLGIRGYVTIAILSMLQIVVAVLPAEPVQVVAGLIYGLWGGILACTVGVVLGNTLIFILYKIYGDKMRNYFDKKLSIDLDSAGNSKKIAFVIFLLYFLPAIPYGMICFLAATMGMKYPRYIAITVLGAIPSVFIGVSLGHIALASSWIISVAVFGVLVLVIAFIMLKKDYLIGKLNDYIKKMKEPYSSKTVVKKYSCAKLNIAHVIFNLIFARKLKIRLKKETDRLVRPSIVLCNHGAFIDFAYAGMLTKKESPNFIVARLYFYKKSLGRLLRAVGCFPKSMFAPDTESAMNSIRVIKGGGVLAMMPEARLSTVGKYEDIQESTFGFIKKMGVHVYSVKICGDYLANPKWGKGVRGGSVVEAELKTLFTAEELASLSEAEVKERTVERLKYNEFDWLEAHPELHYKSKRMAEGLENILSRCPHCGAHYSIKTKGSDLWCEKCNLKTSVTDRYAFENGSPFGNFADWYEWQTDVIRKEIAGNGDYALRGAVELRHASKDGKTLLTLAGEGECTLTREGLTYRGTEWGEQIEKHFPMSQIYRLLFGAGEDFEIYVGKEIYYFTPSERRSCVDWYIASILLKDEFSKQS